MLWKTVSLKARERLLVTFGRDVGGMLISSESGDVGTERAVKENEVSIGTSRRPLKGVEVAAAVSSGSSIALSRRGVLEPAGIAETSFPGLILNILEVSGGSPSLSGGEKTSIALGRVLRARRSTNEVGEGSEVVAEASGLMTLWTSREKKRTFCPVPGVFGSRRMDLTLLNVPSGPGVMEGVSRDWREVF